MLIEKLFIAAQHLLPQHALSRLMGRLTHCRNRQFKNLFIRSIVKAYDVNVSEAAEPDIEAYSCFNDFFTRPLKPGARPIATRPGTLSSPADGCVSQAGPIEQGQIIQAKGHDYSVTALLGGEASCPADFEGGCFSTIYLSPRDYHRLHMPLSGQLREMVHIPGQLFSVNDATVRGVPNLFARNERVVARFDTEVGPMALVLVGAIFVASIETVWHGVVTPPSSKQIQRWQYAPGEVNLERGDELGRFNMGSTIIVLFGKDAVEWNPELTPGHPLRMGECIGICSPA